MLIEESIVRTQAVFNQDKSHRTLLKKTWDEDRMSAAILMSNASTADILRIDFTTMYIINNLSALNYGSVSIVNLFSFMTTKLDLKGKNLDELSNEENTARILQSAKECDIFIVATGRIADTHKKVAVYQHKLFQELRAFQDKIHTIAAYDGTTNLHPLSTKLRSSWTLVPYQLPSPTNENMENGTQADVMNHEYSQKNKKMKKPGNA